ncbi:MAG: methionine--tRNA ligase [Candidatus Aureabacteria bacterium]|nr:methionine--tRNA ligase [Candidatus Auribacterota bacterium]
MEKTFYLTTAIDYVNALPHVGTAYEKIGADALARFKRLCGVETFFLMGVDEHSANVERQARANGVPPQAYCDEMCAKFESVWRTLDISYDRFIRTSEPAHAATVREIFQRIARKGDIYKGKYRGWYCVSCEAFLKDSDLKDGLCPSHGKKPEWIEEDNCFFALSRYADPLKRHIEEHPEFIRPGARRNEILSFLSEGLEDISVSRAGAAWGIRCPSEESQSIYVWFDALINYVTGAGFHEDREGFARRWPADLHIVGKDITRFHCLIWPAMLMAADIPLPVSVWGHGFVHLGGEKMSKTRGTAIDPSVLAGEYGADSLRYFLLREVPFDRDGEFTLQKFINRYNADLANDLGNLCQRTLVIVAKYLGGAIPPPPADAGEAEGGLRHALLSVREPLCRDMEEMHFHSALERIWAAVACCNRYIDESAPWKLRKEANGEKRLAAVMYTLCESLRILALFIQPFMPMTSTGIRQQLGLTADVKFGSLRETEEFGILEAGLKIGRITPLFPKKEQ